LKEHRLFWARAAVAVPRHKGICVEGLTELGHNSFIQYKPPATGEPLSHFPCGLAWARETGSGTSST
jgi:hypothetical protein